MSTTIIKARTDTGKLAAASIKAADKIEPGKVLHVKAEPHQRAEIAAALRRRGLWKFDTRGDGLKARRIVPLDPGSPGMLGPLGNWPEKPAGNAE